MPEKHWKIAAKKEGLRASYATDQANAIVRELRKPHPHSSYIAEKSRNILKFLKDIGY